MAVCFPANDHTHCHTIYNHSSSAGSVGVGFLLAIVAILLSITAGGIETINAESEKNFVRTHQIASRTFLYRPLIKIVDCGWLCRSLRCGNTTKLRCKNTSIELDHRAQPSSLDIYPNCVLTLCAVRTSTTARPKIRRVQSYRWQIQIAEWKSKQM